MRRLLLAAVLAATSLGAAHAAESDITVVGGIDFGFKKLRLDTGDGGNDGRVLTSSFMTLNPSVGIAYGSFYAALSIDKSIHSEPDIYEDGGGRLNRLDFNRAETIMTLGYRLNSSFSVFAGYTRADNDFLETYQYDSGGGDLASAAKEISYTEKGPFLGVAYNKSFTKGTLALSVAYARLDSELIFEEIPVVGSVDAPTEGDNTGHSFSVIWTGPMTDTLSYRVGFRGTRYEMEEPQQIIEKYSSYFIGISNFF